MAKPYAQEEDVLVFLEPGGERQYLYVYNVEDIVLDDRTSWSSSNAVASGTLTTYTQMTELEPNKTTPPEHEIYQVRVGVRGGGLVFVELNAGEARRGTWKKPRPSSSNYWVGYMTDLTSPYEDPQFEMFLKHNQYPAFAVYNPWKARKLEVKLGFVGKKLRCYDLTDPKTPNAIGVEPATVQNILNGIRGGREPHRAITPRGITR